MKADKNHKIYVAGSRGLVGSAIVRKLRSEGYTNIVERTHSELDLRNQSDCDDFFEAERPEYVFLAAAKVGGIIANNTYKADFIYDNLMIAANVIHSSHEFGVKKLLNLGSSCIYPKLAPQPMREEHLLTGELEPTNEAYAISKIAAIKLCTFFNKQYGTNFISLMPTNLYGPNDNFNLETSHVLPALVRKVLLAKAMMEGDKSFILNDVAKRKIGFGIDDNIDPADFASISLGLQKVGIGKDSIGVWGTGSPLREFLHADDLADASVYFMENHDYSSTGDFVNIGSGSEISIKDLISLICLKAGYEGQINYDTTKPDGTPRKLLDVSKAKALGWNAKISLEEGIMKVIAEYKQI